jgi:hypothetical protein
MPRFPLFILFLFSSLTTTSAGTEMEDLIPTKNPVTVEWLQDHISGAHPRLILTPELLETAREKIAADGPEAPLYAKLRADANALVEKPPLERILTGRRLLDVSRKAVGRTLALAMVYKVEGNPIHLERLELELTALCNFPDWNPSHFLDVAEMAVAIALPLDWCADELGEETRKLAQDALLHKALVPGLADSGDNWWFDADNNWNLVCHGGLAVAALAIFEEYPEVAAQVIHRSIEKAPVAFGQYAPDGAYGEGPSYWKYATDYLTLTLSAYQTALNTDFGLEKARGIKQSALFSLLTGGPSGDFYNYFDAGTKGYMTLDHLGLLAWFAPRVRQDLSTVVLEYLPSAIKEEKSPVDRFSSIYLLNFLQMPQGLSQEPLPNAWLAGGSAPVGVLAPETDDGLYLAAKGGSASDSHGDMDAGSFILEWRKIRWSIDPGKQDYTQLEAAIGVKGLWDFSQQSPRWDLLAKNNFGHSTLTVNGEKHLSKGRVLIDAQDLDSPNPSFGFDLTPLYGDSVDSVRRSFKRLDEDSLCISDNIIINKATQSLIWQMVTQAEVELTQDGAILQQEGETLHITVQSPDKFTLRIVRLTPPPSPIDIEIPNFKRIEILVTPEAFDAANGRIAVKLAGLPSDSPTQ